MKQRQVLLIFSIQFCNQICIDISEKYDLFLRKYNCNAQN